jgi:DNA-directed RNA polymerase specialized sigma24 family protein
MKTALLEFAASVANGHPFDSRVVTEQGSDSQGTMERLIQFIDAHLKVRGKGLSLQDREDIRQTCLVDVWKRLRAGHLPPLRSARNYLRASINNQVITVLRRRTRARRHDGTRSPDDCPAPACTPDHDELIEEFCDLLRRRGAGGLVQVFLLKANQGMTDEACRSVLGLTDHRMKWMKKELGRLFQDWLAGTD